MIPAPIRTGLTGSDLLGSALTGSADQAAGIHPTIDNHATNTANRFRMPSTP
jgi:hypothetical protein